jgi:RNA polymerase sigma-70 factor (ECF subfamily)
MTSLEPPRTRLTLIAALRHGLRWEEFVALYGQLILAWSRRLGLQASDAEDVRQEVLIRVWKGIAGYDPTRGRFRAWLYTCTRNAVANLRRDGPRECSVAAAEVPVPGKAAATDVGQALRELEEEGFTTEELQVAVRRVRDAVQPTTWKAFLLFEFFELTAKEIAPQFGLTPAAVNQAVYRVRQSLKRALQPIRGRAAQ